MPKSDIIWTIEDIASRVDGYNRARAYYDGEHDLLFATEKFRNTFGPLFQEFSDNLCDAVVDSLAERLVIASWDGAHATQVEKWWKDPTLALPRFADEVMLESVREGDSYMVVWPDADNVIRFWPNNADMMTVAYDDEDDPCALVKAGKVWIDGDGFGRCTLYYEDTIEKYRTVNACDEKGTVPDKPDAWGDAKTIENPHGVVPVFHFGNAAEVGGFGRTQLHNTFHVQDALNKAICDMLVAMEFVAMPQRYVTGLQIDTDEDTGKPRNPPFTPGVDRIWTASGDNVSFGEFRQADLRPFLDVQDAFRVECARTSATPPHYLGLSQNIPTGEALKVIEGRFIRRITNRQRDFGAVWSRMMAFALRIESESKPDITPVWDNPAPHNPLLDAETQLVKQQVGLSKKRSLKELGYSDEEIIEIMAEKDAEMVVAVGNAPGQPGVDTSGKPTAFNRNGGPGKVSTPAPMQQQQSAVPIPRPRVSQSDYQEAS